MPAITKALPPIRHLDATSLPLAIHIEPDLRILGFSVLLCGLTALLSGIGPALQAARCDLYSSLRARTEQRWSVRHGLVAAQIALCTLLLAGAGLLVATLERLRRVDPGVDRDHLVTFSLDPEMRRYTPEQASALESRLVSRVQALPGVDGAAIAARGLMRGTGLKATVVLPGQSYNATDGLNASVNVVSPGYFSTLGIRLVEGQNYRDNERLDRKPRPTVVNQAFVRRFFGGLDPVGRQFGAKAEFEIIGVVSDAKYRSLREPITPTMYFLHKPGSGDFILHVRTRFKPEPIIASIEGVLRSLDPELPFYEIKTLAEEVDSSLWSERLLAALASFFAAAAALLAAIGIYGLLSFLVAQWTHEIGIRMALGARPLHILRMVSLQTIAIVIIGVMLGALGSVAASPWIAHLLYGASATDGLTLGVVATFVALTAAVATALPAARAVSVEPAIALRQET